MFRSHMVEVHIIINEAVIFQFLSMFFAQVSRSPDACPMVHKNEKQTCHCQSASAGKYCNYLRQFLPRQIACMK